MKVRPKLIPFYQEGNKMLMLGIDYNPNTSWYLHVFTPYFGHILKGLENANKNESKKYVEWLNDMLTSHSTLYEWAKNKGDFLKTGFRGGKRLDVVGSYQRRYLGDDTSNESEVQDYNLGKFNYNIGISNATRNNRYKISPVRRLEVDRPGNDNRFGIDGVYSGETDDRRILGRLGDYTQDQLKYVQKELNKRGYLLVLGQRDYYYLKPYGFTPGQLEELPEEHNPIINTSEIDPSIIEQTNPSSTTPPVLNPSEPNKESILGDTKPGSRFWENFLASLKKYAPDMLGTARLFGALANNERVYGAMLKGIRPNLQLGYSTHRLVFGDEATKQAFYRRGIQGVTRASRPFTSDADRQMAMLMESYRQANELKEKGDLADNQEIKKTSELSNEHLDRNIQRANLVANTNIIEINKANAAKLNIIALKHTANWTGIDNFLKGIETKLTQEKEEEKALEDEIWALETQQGLDEDPTYQQALDEYNKVIEESKVNGIVLYTPAVKEATKKLKKARNNYLINRKRLRIGKSGTKITYKRKDDLLYKSTKDAVEHFRKMTKMLDESTRRSRSKPVKLVSPPRSRKMLLGGVAPFFIYTPAVSGGEKSIATSTETSVSRRSDSESSSKKKDPLDILKQIFLSVGESGMLPSDANYVYEQMNDLFQRASLFGTEMDTNDIASMYISVMLKINNAKHSKLNFDLAKKEATEKGALNEFAVTTDGRYVVQNAETGELRKVSLLEIVLSEGKLNPITNNLLLDLRAYSPSMAFKSGDSLMQIINNGVGVDEIGKYIKSVAISMGNSEIKLEGMSSAERQQLKEGMEILLGGLRDVRNRNQKLLAQAALNYLIGILPKNMKAVLDIEALHSGISTSELLTSYISGQVSNLHEEESPTGSGSSNKKEGTEGLKLDAPTALITGKGYLDIIEFNPGTSYAVVVNARHSGFLKKSGENMGSGITMKEATTSTLDLVLDWSKATLGGSRLNPTGYNRIMINNNDVVGVDLPVDLDKTKPDFTMLQKLQLLDLELLKRGIEDTSNNWQLINLICQEIGLPSKYKNDGHLNDYSWNRFAAFLVTTDDSVLTNKNIIIDDILEIVEDDNIRDLYEEIILKDNKNYKLGNGFLGFGKQALYQGTVFVPIKSNYVAAALSGGQNITMSQATDLELKGKEYDTSKIATYKPGMNFSEL